MSEPLRFELCLPVTIKGLDTCKTVELEARFTVLASSAEEAKVQLQEALYWACRRERKGEPF